MYFEEWLKHASLEELCRTYQSIGMKQDLIGLYIIRKREEESKKNG